MDDIHVLVVDEGEQRARTIAAALEGTSVQAHFAPISDFVVSVSPHEPYLIEHASRPFPGFSNVGEMVGEKLVDCVPEVERTAVWGALCQAASGDDDEAIGHAALLHTAVGTDEEHVEVSLGIVTGPTAKSLTVTARDLAERAQAEAQREALQRQVHQIQRLEAVGTLAGGIAHDFNNILQAVTGFTSMVLEELPASDPNRVLLEHVMTAGNRGQELVQRILTLSRSNKVKSEEVIELEPLLEKVLDLARAAVPSSISMRIDKQTQRTTVRGDRAELTQVFMNLVTNAFQAIGTHSGTIIVSTAIDAAPKEVAKASGLIQPPEYIRVDVRDTGEGMRDEVADQCFDPFFTTRAVGEGTGLGLSVSRTIVRAHGGVVAVSSEVGVGTRFSVYLPVMAPRKRTTRQERKLYRTQPAAAAGARLLVVDDEPMIAMYLEKTLSRKGYLVTRCADVATAWLAWENASPKFDGVVTDFAMPGGTGLELAEKLRDVEPKLPIVLLTGYANPDTEKGCRALDVRLLTKPVTSRVLLKTLAQAFESAAVAAP